MAVLLDNGGPVRTHQWPGLPRRTAEHGMQIPQWLLHAMARFPVVFHVNPHFLNRGVGISPVARHQSVTEAVCQPGAQALNALCWLAVGWRVDDLRRLGHGYHGLWWL